MVFLRRYRTRCIQVTNSTYRLANQSDIALKVNSIDNCTRIFTKPDGGMTTSCIIIFQNPWYIFIILMVRKVLYTILRDKCMRPIREISMPVGKLYDRVFHGSRAGYAVPVHVYNV